MSVSTITPFRYAGGKSKLLPIIGVHLDKLLQNSESFLDLFVGGGSVALWVATKYPKHKLILNDKDKCVSAFWEVVSGDNLQDFNDLLSMLDTAPTVEQYYKLKDNVPEGKLAQAHRSFFLNRTAFSGIIGLANCIGGKDQKSKYKIDCRYNYPKLKQKIINCRNLLVGRTKVYNKDFSDVAEANDSNIVLYSDSPYYEKGDILYPEKMSKEDHIKLSNILIARDNWIASYDDNKVIRNLYKNNNIIDLSVNYSINGNKTSWTSKNELLILK